MHAKISPFSHTGSAHASVCCGTPAMVAPLSRAKNAVHMMCMCSLWQQLQRAQLVEFRAVECKRRRYPHSRVRLQAMPGPLPELGMTSAHHPEPLSDCSFVSSWCSLQSSALCSAENKAASPVGQSEVHHAGKRRTRQNQRTAQRHQRND